ncbi:MAG: hypothetical protein ABIB04_00495 [Patescibacteria group bacterium]
MGAISLLIFILLANPLSLLLVNYSVRLFRYLYYIKSFSYRVALDLWLKHNELKQLLQNRDRLRRELIKHCPQTKQSYRIMSFTSPDEYLRWRIENPRNDYSEEEIEFITLEEKIKRLGSPYV